MMRKMVAALAATTMIAGAALATAPTASAASPGSTVGAWYADFLGRDADPGSQYWVDRLAVQAPGDVLWAITHSDEYNRGEIIDDYAYYLNRDLDPGAGHWIEGTNAQRFPLEWVEQNVAASPEFVNPSQRKGALVGRWFRAIFGDQRPVTTDELAYWGLRVQRAGALAAFRELYYTPEAVTVRVQDWYALLLGRKPSPGELAYWYPKEVESDINVGVLIASTPEYADLAD